VQIALPLPLNKNFDIFLTSFLQIFDNFNRFHILQNQSKSGYFVAESCIWKVSVLFLETTRLRSPNIMEFDWFCILWSPSKFFKICGKHFKMWKTLSSGNGSAICTVISIHIFHRSTSLWLLEPTLSHWQGALSHHLDIRMWTHRWSLKEAVLDQLEVGEVVPVSLIYVSPLLV